MKAEKCYFTWQGYFFLIFLTIKGWENLYSGGIVLASNVVRLSTLAVQGDLFVKLNGGRDGKSSSVVHLSTSAEQSDLLCEV